MGTLGWMLRTGAATTQYFCVSVYYFLSIVAVPIYTPTSWPTTSLVFLMISTLTSVRLKKKGSMLREFAFPRWTFVTVFIGRCYFFFGKPSIQLMSSMVDWIILGDSSNVWSSSEILVINPHQMGSCGGSWFCWLLPFSKMGPLSLHSLLYFLSL